MPTQFHPELDAYVEMPLACALAAVYVVLGLAGNRFMADREPLQLTIPKLIYNSTQVVVCSITFVKLLPFFTVRDSGIQPPAASRQLLAASRQLPVASREPAAASAAEAPSLNASLSCCQTAEHGYGIGIVSQATVEYWVFVYYCCKLLDFCDTLFMVLGKKTRQYTLLHVWHHASIVPLFGYDLSTGMGGGFISALPVWNSLVHVIMYSHYLITSLFTFKRMWWKPIITASQMGHHVLIMMYMILNRVYVRPTATATAILPHTLQLSLRLWSVGSTETATLTPRVRAHERLCQENPECTWAVCIYAVLWGCSILGLFAHFFLQSYLAKPKGKEGKSS